MSIESSSTAILTAVRGNASLVLADPETVWIVKNGTVDVFAVRVEAGAPTGPRRYLFTCSQGELLFGAAPEVCTDQRTFLVVGVEESELSSVCWRSPHGAPAMGTSERTTLVKQWVRRISAVVAESVASSYSERAHCNGPIPLAEGQSIRPIADQVLWLSVVAGEVGISELSNFQLDQSTGLFPASGDLRLVAHTESIVRFHGVDEDISPSSIAAGMARLHQACFTKLRHSDDRQRQVDAQRLTERLSLQREETSEVLGELDAILVSRRTAVSHEDALIGALSLIGDRLGVKFRWPKLLADDGPADNRIQAIARASRLRTRRVLLRGRWWQEDAGPILGQRTTGQPVALLPSTNGYMIYDAASGASIRVDPNVAASLSRDAMTFTVPLPEDATSLAALGRFALRPIAPDVALIIFLAAAVTLLGMLVPIATGLIIDEAIPDANLNLLIQLAAGLLAMALAQVTLSYAQGMMLLRTDTQTTARLQSAVMDRVLRIPARFFRNYSSGDLQNRLMMITEISRDISNTAIGSILTGGMAILNLVLCVYFNAKLAMLAVASAALIAAYTSGLSVMIRSAARKFSIGQGKLFGFQVQLISGIAKLRVAGAEQRAFNNWAYRMAQQLRLMNGIQRMEHWGELVNTALQHTSVILLYFFAAQMLTSGASATVAAAGPTFLTMGTFLAFYVAFQKTIGGLTGLSATLVDLGDTWAKRKLVMPLLEELPEDSAAKVDPGPLAGALSLSHITFRYRSDGPLVLRDVSIHANAGQFVAIVGPSGCGKSTLLRVLLGFETPESGTIYYDGQDLAGLDSTAVRRQIGAVLQSGVVNSGSIYENIAGAARVSLDETWEAARAAGLAEDIQQMPMGMHTFVNEGGGTLSGGQRQRLLIARALVTGPRIIIFDEATSALDNRTQQIVTESMDRLQVTRIVVAHRLSTIRGANRIYVMEEGKVVQSGTFDELANHDGLFRRMIARQLA